MDERDSARQLTTRTIKTIIDDMEATEPYAGSEAPATAFQIGFYSDYGLERLEGWLSGMLRQHPLDSPLWSAHRHLVEALLRDIQAEIARRERNGAS